MDNDDETRVPRMTEVGETQAAREERHTRENARLSAVFLVVFGFTFWLAGYDWIMSLEPHWYSTIFAVYQFAGLVLSGLAMITILAIWLEKQGPLKGALTHEHLHDLGKLLFAFSTFWMYIWFCQYMLIWYANIPEETVHYVHRLHGFWEPVFLLNFLLNWAVPFLVLLHVPAKRSRSMMLKVCWVILVGRWVDLYLMIMPPIAGEQLAVARNVEMHRPVLAGHRVPQARPRLQVHPRQPKILRPRCL